MLRPSHPPTAPTGTKTPKVSPAFASPPLASAWSGTLPSPSAAFDLKLMEEDRSRSPTPTTSGASSPAHSPLPVDTDSPSPPGTAQSAMGDGAEAKSIGFKLREGEEAGPSSSGAPLQGGGSSEGVSAASLSSSMEEKKKRTRTLTTPYQSAMLHSLLAQSRFPTTQMREDVGRKIGLSARKVQIWFQNQRQKAKRTAQASVSGTPSARPPPPPQYGPYTNAPAVAPTTSTTTAVALDPGFGGSISGMMFSSGGLFGGAPPPRTKPPPPAPYRRSSGGAGPLAGPGMPGSALPSLPEDGAPMSVPPQQLPASGPYRESTAARSARSLSRSLSRLSTTSSISSWQPVPPRRPPSRASSHSYSPGGDTSLPLTLAPLLLDEPDHMRPSTAGSAYSERFPPMPSPLSASHGPSGPLAASHASLPQAASSSSLALAGDLASRRLPELTPALPGPVSRLGLPPPFTLEPAPRWDRASHDPFAPTPRSKTQHADDRVSEASYSPPGISEPRMPACPHPPPGLHYSASGGRSASPVNPPESPMDEDRELKDYRAR